jgi:ATP-dependent RNA helicase RhlE
MISAGIMLVHGNKGQTRTKARGFKGTSYSSFDFCATDIAARSGHPLFILNCLILSKITFTALVEQEEPEQEKLFRYSVDETVLRDIEKLVGLNLPKENIRFSSQILMLQEPTNKEDSNVQLRKQKH